MGCVIEHDICSVSCLVIVSTHLLKYVSVLYPHRHFTIPMDNLHNYPKTMLIHNSYYYHLIGQCHSLLMLKIAGA